MNNLFQHSDTSDILNNINSLVIPESYDHYIEHINAIDFKIPYLYTSDLFEEQFKELYNYCDSLSPVPFNLPDWAISQLSVFFAYCYSTDVTVNLKLHPSYDYHHPSFSPNLTLHYPFFASHLRTPQVKYLSSILVLLTFVHRLFFRQHVLHIIRDSIFIKH